MGERSDILRLKACPQCDYDLVGLPGAHACPECGFEYDESTFRLDVWPLDDEPKLGALVFNGLLTLMMLLLSIALIGAGSTILWWQTWPFFCLLVFAGSFLVMCRRTVLHLKGRTSSTLVLSKRGYQRVWDNVPGKWTTWENLPTRMIRRLRRRRWRLLLKTGPWRRFFDAQVSYVFKADKRTAAAVRKRLRQFSDPANRP
ncbi:MAG: hypothetical protein O7G85_08780 [Planctomycetota bacterium]|nr:hypothetical protein [Planctomycetota bacterium]